MTIIKHRSSSLWCFFVPSVRAYAYSVSAVVRFAISLLYSSWVISPFARSSHLIRTTRGFLEGLPCAGKSTTARYIAEQTGGAFFDEDCAEHPADYTFHAFIPDGSEGFTAEETALLREYGTPQPGGIVVPLTLSNFNEHSLDDFPRRQQVTEVWRRNGNEMELVYQPFVEDWDADVRREAAERMLGNLRRGYFGTGAERIFISSHSAKESQAAYKALGCVPARELFREAAETEPFDIQLEFDLT